MRKNLFIAAAWLCCSAAVTAQEYVTIGEGDESYTFPIEEIDSITYAENYIENYLPAHIEADSKITIFGKALEITGVDKLLNQYIDYSYQYGGYSGGHHLFYRCRVTCPRYRKLNFTVFAEPDTVYAKYGIKSVDDLKAYAAKIYDEMYPEDAGIKDPTDRRNSLNRFVAYHILNRRGEYYKLTCVDGPESVLATNFDRTVQDIADWYETLMPHSILKCSFPDGAQSGLYINRRGVQDHADERGVFVPGAKVLHSGEENYEIGTDEGIINGVYYYIDDIIAYGKETQEVVLDERMRIDCTTLSPDFMTSGARGHGTLCAETNYMYGTPMYDSYGDGSPNTCYGFTKAWGMFYPMDNIINQQISSLCVSNRFLNWRFYQGDIIGIVSQCNDEGGDIVTFKLPPVPAGTYELRLGVTSCSYGVWGYRFNGGVLGFRLDNQQCGESVDFRIDGGHDESIGWKDESCFYDYSTSGILWDGYCKYFDSLYSAWYENGCVGEEPQDTQEMRDAYSEIAKKEYFKALREKGWMYGPASYASGNWITGGENREFYDKPFYEDNRNLRRIITTFTTDGKTDHYLTIYHDIEAQRAIDEANGQSYTYNNVSLQLDYIELCPSSVYDNELYPEDKY